LMHGPGAYAAMTGSGAPETSDQVNCVMNKLGHGRTWAAAALALAAFAFATARAQESPPSAPAGDVFASQGQGYATYSDAYTSTCKDSNNQFAGMNPFTCHPEAANCGLQAPGLTVWKEAGSSCIYCLAIIPPKPPEIGIVIPWDQGWVAEGQGFSCAVNLTNMCTTICIGKGPFKPPAGLTLESEPPGQPPPAPQPPENPPPSLNTPTPPGLPSPPPDTQCVRLKQQNRPKFTAAQLATLSAAVAKAKEIVAKVKTYTDKNPWDNGTLDIGQRYFGDTRPATQNFMREQVNNVLDLLNGLDNLTSTFYPPGADTNPPNDAAEAFAYTPRDQVGPPLVFLGGRFWNSPTDGPDSQAMIIVHEFAHLPGGLGDDDFAYGQPLCHVLVFLSTKLGGKPLAGWSPVPIKLTSKSPPITTTSPLENPESFEYFVYEVSQQK